MPIVAFVLVPTGPLVIKGVRQIVGRLVSVSIAVASAGDPLYAYRNAWRGFMPFVVVPVNRQFDPGYWVQAADADEARLLVSLNVPGMEDAVSLMFASCERDDRYAPAFGAITGGTGRTYTITRRRPKEADRI